MERNRVILHIDMDAFYASIEQRDNPELRGKPVAVGGSSQRGVVAAASYEARKFGVHSAMPSAIAKRRCPDLIFVRARFDVYRSLSHEIREIFLEHTPLVEPLSLDEAYLDISNVVASITAGEEVARKIRKDIYSSTRLRASAGISFNKFLAKMASDINKPDGQYAILRPEADHFLRELPVQMFHGIGSATAEKMKRLKIEYGKDLVEWPVQRLVEIFGKAGHHYYHIVRGEDNRAVNPNRIRKSVGVERTYGENLEYRKDISNALDELLEKLTDRVKRHGRTGKTITLKLRYSDFETITRSRTHYQLLDYSAMRYYSDLLINEAWQINRPVRLLGLTISNLEGEGFGKQLKLRL